MKVYRNEAGYLELLKDILVSGVDIPDRTGVGTRAIFDAKIVYDVDEIFPFSTVRPAPLRLAFEEFWFFLNGKTQTKELESKGVNFWKGNTTREFLDNLGLFELPEGDMGKAYGYQLRNFGGVDQLKYTFEILENDKYSRRVYNTMWNPKETHLMSLTPCHHSHQFVVLPTEDGKDVLHLKLLNRSLDALFGLSFAVQQYALYLMVVAKKFGFEVGKLSVDLTHVHLYHNQLEYTEELLTRPLGTNGTVKILKDVKTLQDILEMKWDDFEIKGLEVNNTPFITKRPTMAV